MEGDKTLIPSSSSITISGDVYNGLLNKIEQLEGLVATYESKIDLQVDYDETRVFIKEVWNKYSSEHWALENPIKDSYDLLEGDGPVYIGSCMDKDPIHIPSFRIRRCSNKGSKLSAQLERFVEKQEEILTSNYVQTPSIESLEGELNKLKQEIKKANVELKRVYQSYGDPYEKRKEALDKDRAKLDKELTNVPEWLINLCNAWN